MSHGQFIGAVRARRTVNGLLLAETEYSSGLSIGSHPHDEALCCLVLEGAMTERWGRHQVECEAGRMTFLPPDVPHGQEYHAEDSRCFLVQVGAPWIDRMREMGVKGPDGPVDLSKSRANWMASHLYQEFRSDDAAAALAIEGLTLTMLGEIARTAVQQERTAKPAWLLRAVDILHASVQEPVSMAEIAAEVNIHPTHLAQTFREQYGCTMGEYLRRLRVEAARAELTSTRKSLAAIALDAGFSDQAHFTRVFKRLTGETPGAWRRAVAL